MKHIFLFFTFLSLWQAAAAQRNVGTSNDRVALVIGNAAYQYCSPLTNTLNDADDMAKVLTELGFDVTKVKDGTLQSMTTKLDEFTDKMRNAQLALVFYSGHGLEVKGINYMIPIDANLKSENDVTFRCVPVGLLLGRMEDMNTTNIVLLDACRDNPFAKSWKSANPNKQVTQGGLGKIDAPQGTFIGFATSPGKTASDGVGTRNSPYTTAILKHIKKPNVHLLSLFNTIGNEVAQQSGKTQVPWNSSSPMPENLFLSIGTVAQPSVESPHNPVTFTDNDPDGDGFVGSADNCIGIYGKVGGCPDGDEDGIADKDDACPDEAGVAERKGCPAPKDSDNDGVPDAGDECPSEKGYAKWAGCPDSDGDGVPNHRDNCKYDKGEASNNGCPVLDPDSDGDGVKDKYDNCPSTYAATSDGCPEKKDLPDFVTMKRVEGGTFTMGDMFGEGESDETQHQVTLRTYWLGATEVTQDEWVSIMGSNPSYFKCGSCPVEQVSWNDVQEFLQKLNTRYPNRNYRLPTEAEWEYAARERGQKVRFGNGKNTLDPSQANFDASESYKQPYSVVGEYRSKTTAVKTFSPNSLGLYDMAGNVWEWCSDWYGTYPSTSQANPIGAESGSLRVLRGGCWYNSPQYLRCAYRNRYTPDDRRDSFGFRLSRTE